MNVRLHRGLFFLTWVKQERDKIAFVVQLPLVLSVQSSKDNNFEGNVSTYNPLSLQF